MGVKAVYQIDVNVPKIKFFIRVGDGTICSHYETSGKCYVVVANY